MKIEIRKAKLDDITGVKFREQTNVSVRHFVELEFKESLFVWGGFVDEKLIALWGARAPSLFSDEAYAWMVTTKEINSHPLLFLRYSRQALLTLKEYKRVRVLVLDEFEISKRWLRWIGFDVREPINGVCEAWIQPH